MLKRAHILEVCHSERFCDSSVREIYATLLDEGVYLASVATIYRILGEAGVSGHAIMHVFGQIIAR